MKKLISVFVLCMLSMNMIAEEAKVRLQLRKTLAEDTLSLSNCSGKSIGLKDSSSWGDTHLYAGNLYLKKLSNEWNEFSFSFTPNKDGKLRIVLHSLGDSDTAFDSFSSDQIEISNGSFELVSANGKPKHIMNTESGAVLKNAQEAQAGNNFIKLSKEERFSFLVNTKANKPVTISFYAKKIVKVSVDI
ncbi:hypothetical protein PQO01_15765 [Lentisphaera marina]|uniref:hypothetical protein n=1 Tax=Lentisphaera marina TaxID=1111041 RepID=UPI002366BE58|nr:hypothetical protein [Lentisphaera marina]MDD7986407.1 hypothetical protein [Lentisphaera marina]